MPARILLLLYLAGCGASTPEPVPAAKRQKKGVREEAAENARDVILEVYASLRRGDSDGMNALAATDAFVIGPEADQLYTTRADVVVALAGTFKPGDRHTVTSRALQVTASPAAKAAWAIDRVELDGRPYHMTAILVESDELWQIAVVHVGEATGIPEKKPPKPPALAAEVGPGANEIVDRFKLGAKDPEKFLDQMDKKESYVLGPSPREMAHGLKAIKKVWKKALRRHPKLALQPELRATLSPDGTLGWVLAYVDYEDDQADKMRHRYMLVYERGKEDWRLMSIHSSVGMK